MEMNKLDGNGNFEGDALYFRFETDMWIMHMELKRYGLAGLLALEHAWGEVFMYDLAQFDGDN
jgi:hypothetical protein